MVDCSCCYRAGNKWTPRRKWLHIVDNGLGALQNGILLKASCPFHYPLTKYNQAFTRPICSDWPWCLLICKQNALQSSVKMAMQLFISSPAQQSTEGFFFFWRIFFPDSEHPSIYFHLLLLIILVTFEKFTEFLVIFVSQSNVVSA